MQSRRYIIPLCLPECFDNNGHCHCNIFFFLSLSFLLNTQTFLPGTTPIETKPHVLPYFPSVYPLCKSFIYRLSIPSFPIFSCFFAVVPAFLFFISMLLRLVFLFSFIFCFFFDRFVTHPAFTLCASIRFSFLISFPYILCLLKTNPQLSLFVTHNSQQRRGATTQSCFSAEKRKHLSFLCLFCQTLRKNSALRVEQYTFSGTLQKYPSI